MRGKFLVISLAGGVAALALMSGVALAQQTPTPSATPTATPTAFIQALAQVLNMPVETVQAAVAIAEANVHREKLDQAVAQRLAAAVEAGRITQQEADQANSWWQNRPQIVDRFGGLFHFKALERQDGNHGTDKGRHDSDDDDDD